MALWHENLTRYDNKRNNQFDRRLHQTTFAPAQNITRGKIETSRVIRSGPVPKRHTFHFLTNPSEISLGYSTHEGIDLTDPANTSILSDLPPLTNGLLTCNFGMLLDRTYEVWEGSLPEGVLHDIAQLERVLGVPDTYAGATVTRGADGVFMFPRGDTTRVQHEAAYSIFPGILVKRPVRIFFGGSKAFNFDGYVTGLSISLQKFNSRMSPTRASIEISATSWGEAPGWDGIGSDRVDSRDAAKWEGMAAEGGVGNAKRQPTSAGTAAFRAGQLV